MKNVGEKGEYETWEVGTLFVTKQRFAILRHSPDPWDFQSKNFIRIILDESENFILMSPIKKEEYHGIHFTVCRILHPIHGKTVVALRTSWGTEIKEYIAPVLTSEEC